MTSYNPYRLPTQASLLGRIPWASRDQAQAILPAITTVLTQTSLVPAVNMLSPAGGAVRIWAGDTPFTEPEFDLLVNVSGNVRKIRMNRWQSCVIRTAAFATIGFGTSDGRVIRIAADNARVTLNATFGATGTANADKGAPPIWTPVAPHITLGSDRSFELPIDTTVRVVFVSEFDGVRWSPARWVRTSTTRAIRVHCTFSQVALANRDGTPLAINAPAGSTIGGVSTLASLPFPAVTGTTRNVSNDTELVAAVAAAVAGDAIVLADGTYTTSLTRSSFTSNHTVGGRLGAEGITIRSASGNQATCVVNGSWTFVHGSGLFCLKGIGFSGNGISGTPLAVGPGRFLIEDVAVNGTGTSAPDLITVEGGTGSVVADFNRCDASNGFEDCWNFSGGASFNAASRVRTICCSGSNSGNFANSQVYTTHFGLLVEDYCGDYSNAHSFAIQGALSGDTQYLFWTRVRRGARNAGVSFVCCYGVDIETTAQNVGVEGTGFCMASLLSSLVPVNNGFIRDSSNASRRFVGNRITGSTGYAWFPSAGTNTQFDFNTVTGSFQSGIRQSNSTAAGTATARYNSFIGNTIAFDLSDANLSMVQIGNATRTSANSIVCTPSSATRITSRHNVYDPIVDADFIAGTGDTVGVDAGLDADGFPVAGGNCDGTGNPADFDFVGGIDFQGFPLRLAMSVQDRGGRCRPRIIAGAELIPDLW